MPPFSKIRPPLKIGARTRALIESSDVLVMTGGDIISADYGLESLFYWMSICEVAMNAGIKTVLWGASVGPFDSEPDLEKRMTKFLSRFDLITVRETASFEYLNRLGLQSHLVSDSAFSLDPESLRKPIDIQARPDGSALLGFNVSPVIEKFRSTEDGRKTLFTEVVMFLGDVVRNAGDRVLLVPHVDPFDVGGAYNSDSIYLKRILQALREEGLSESSVCQVPATLNAAELKTVIGGCDYFMGGRTHATVAALSMGVPTTSIAYSVKAKGINWDLFGHYNYVLETPDVSRDNLNLHFARLKNNRSTYLKKLGEVLPAYRRRSERSAELLVELLRL